MGAEASPPFRRSVGGLSQRLPVHRPHQPYDRLLYRGDIGVVPTAGMAPADLLLHALEAAHRGQGAGMPSLCVYGVHQDDS